MDAAQNIRNIKANAKKPNVKIVGGVKKYVIPKLSEKKKKEILDESGKFREDKEMEDWYRAMRRLDVGVCEELGCSNPTFKFDPHKFKFSIAHCVPKSLIPSVRTHPYNYLFLCWQHHSIYDSSWESAKKLNCWKLAKERFSFFKHLIKENHKLLENFE
jgi:hypothetical protein